MEAGAYLIVLELLGFRLSFLSLVSLFFFNIQGVPECYGEAGVVLFRAACFDQKPGAFWLLPPT